MIVNIRGTCGSGKSYAVHKLLEHSSKEPVELVDGRKVAATMVDIRGTPIYALGSYRNVCGGCDGVRKPDIVVEYVEYFSGLGHVIFEGLIISRTWNRYADLCRSLTDVGEQYVWVYMDTSLQVCLDRVRERRARKGNEKELNTFQTTDTYNRCEATRKHAVGAGFDVRTLKYNHPDPGRFLIDILGLDVPNKKHVESEFVRLADILNE
jgi:hypothetical protein